MKHLITTLEAPMMSFGSQAVDNRRPTGHFPALSMLTGLLGNALGWRRWHDADLMDSIQSRIRFASRIDREPSSGASFTDFQVADIGADDVGWTTRGIPEKRGGSKGTYRGKYLRYVDYLADMRISVALRLTPPKVNPALEELGDALREPYRPLFIGRKSCLPSEPLFGGYVDADSAGEALTKIPLPERRLNGDVRVQWLDGEEIAGSLPDHAQLVSSGRDWRSRLHVGGRIMVEASVPVDKFPQLPDDGEEKVT